MHTFKGSLVVLLFYSLIVFLSPDFTTSLMAEVVTVFEHTYVRQTGSPRTQTDTFPGIKGLATIRVTNGGLEKAGSADIVLNKETIINSSNFN